MSHYFNKCYLRFQNISGIIIVQNFTKEKRNCAAFWFENQTYLNLVSSVLQNAMEIEQMLHDPSQIKVKNDKVD